MDGTPLYQQIAESVRREILYGDLKPGDWLPPVRKMATHWRCTPGTVQRAYKELARQGLVVSRTGQGTRVVSDITAPEDSPLRRAGLVNQAEAFLLQLLTAGHTPAEADQAWRLALDRYRTLSEEPDTSPEQQLRFVGSHDPAVSLIAARFSAIIPDHSLQVTFAGSLGGLMALARGEADIAGSHLWDEDSDSYNLPFVKRILPDRKLALITLAQRRLGLIVRAGNPDQIGGLRDLRGSGLQYVNRQRGAGTRIWLDAQMRRLNIPQQSISGYTHEVSTHSEVAQIIAKGEADVGLGVEAASQPYELDFVPLATEPYVFVVPAELWDSPPVQALAKWLLTDEAKGAIANLSGYEIGETGAVKWTE